MDLKEVKRRAWRKKEGCMYRRTNRGIDAGTQRQGCKDEEEMLRGGAQIEDKIEG